MLSKRLKLLLWSSNIWYFGEGMLGPLLAVFAERVGGDILDISIAWAVYLVATGFATILVGKLCDRYDKRKIMVFGYALNAAATFGYLFVQNPIQLFFVQAILGLAGALATPSWDALYADETDPEEEGSEWGIANGTADIVMGIAIILGGFIVAQASFTLLFLGMGIIQTAALIYIVPILWTKPHEL